MKTPNWSVLVLSAAVTALTGCSVERNAELRQYQLVMVGTDRAALQAVFSSPQANEIVRPFQAEGRCKPVIWMPRLSVVTSQDLVAMQPVALDVGFFEKTATVEAAQNRVQSALGQRPTLVELDQAAAHQLLAYKLPAEAASNTARVARAGATAPDLAQALRKLAGRTGVVLYKDEGAQVKEAAPAGGGMAKVALEAAGAKLPDQPLPFADTQSYRSQVHELLCGLPDQDGSAVPTVVLVGVAGALDAVAASATKVATAPANSVKPVAASLPVPSANGQRAFDRGLAMLQQGDLERAVKEFSSAIEIEPVFPAAMANRGVAQLKLKNYGRSLDDMNRAIGMEPQNPVWHYNLAAYYSVRQEVDRGLDALDRALTLGFAKSDNVQIDALKFDANADPDLAALRKRKSEYCALLERHQKFLCK